MALISLTNQNTYNIETLVLTAAGSILNVALVAFTYISTKQIYTVAVIALAVIGTE